jgi:hypothetical protein
MPVVVRVSCSSAAAWASQADFLRDRKISQPAASATTRRMSRVQPRAPSPWDSAAAGVPAADVAGGVVGELGRSAEVGVRSEVGVSAVVRGGRVGSVVVSLGDSVPLGPGRVPERSVEGRVAESLPPPPPQPLSPRTRLSTSPARSPAVVVRRPGMPGATRRSLVADTIGRDSIQDVRIHDHLRISRGRRGKPARHATATIFGPGADPASPEAGENPVPRRARPPRGFRGRAAGDGAPESMPKMSGRSPAAPRTGRGLKAKIIQNG